MPAICLNHGEMRSVCFLPSARWNVIERLLAKPLTVTFWMARASSSSTPKFMGFGPPDQKLILVRTRMRRRLVSTTK
ncbi:MAG: hypothetical protein IPG50_09580 [Myxococcales bacterium]|nr:hypothetical protein [Myxococcales bacterium]